MVCYPFHVKNFSQIVIKCCFNFITLILKATAIQTRSSAYTMHLVRKICLDLCLTFIFTEALNWVNVFIPYFAACTCAFKGNTYQYGDTIYNTTDGLGSCMTAVCEENGVINKTSYTCQTLHPTTTSIPTTIFDFSSKPTGNCFTNTMSSATSF